MCTCMHAHASHIHAIHMASYTVGSGTVSGEVQTTHFAFSAAALFSQNKYIKF